MSNRIDIEIRDRIDDSIAKKLAFIAAAAKAANNQIVALNQSLNGGRLVINNYANGTTRVANAARQSTQAIAQKITAMQRLRSVYSSAIGGARSMAAGWLSMRSGAMLLNTDMLALIRTLRTISGIVVIAGVGKNILDSADAFQVMRNQLISVTDSTGQLNKVQDELFRISNNARAPVNDMTKAFRRFDMALEALGGSQRESIDLTQTVGKLLAMNGSTAQESGAVLLQLSQAFNKGKLDGDEFRSVAELMPQVLDAVAKAAGKSRKDIYEMSRDGKINIDMLRKAFAQLKPEVDKTFSKLPLTIGQSLTILQNSLVKFFGELDKKWGFSKAVIQFVDYVTNNLPQAFRLIETLVVSITAVSIPTIFAALNIFTGGLFTVIGLFSGLVAWVTYFSDKIYIAGSSFLTLRDYVYGFYRFFVDSFSKVGGLLEKVFSPKNAEWFLNNVLIPGWNILVEAIQIAISWVAAFFQSIENMSRSTNIWEVLLEGALYIVAEIYNTFVSLFIELAKIAETTILGIVDKVNRNLPSWLQGPAMLGAGGQLPRDRFSEYENMRQKLSISYDAPQFKNFKDFFENMKVQQAENLQNMTEGYQQAMDTIANYAKQNAMQRIQTEGTVLQNVMMNLKLYTSALKSFQDQSAQYMNAGVFSITQSWGPALANWQMLWTNTTNYIKGLLTQLFAFIQTLATALSSLAGTAGVAVGGLMGQLAAGAYGGMAGTGLGLIGDPNAGLRKQNELLTQMSQNYQNAGNAAADFANKATNGMNGLNNATNDSMNTFMQLAQQAFGHVTDAIIEFTNTGKFEFKKMLKAIVDDLLRFFLNRFFQKMLFSVFGGGFGGMGGMMGGMGGMIGGMGFATGGYTGNLPVNQVAGFVHGREFVMPAGATKRNRSALEAMKRGATVSTLATRGGSNVAMNVSVKNYTDGNIQVRRINQTDVEIIATQVAERTVQERTPRLVANEIRNANSRISKSLTDSTQTRRRR